jgi:hypothetical protein
VGSLAVRGRLSKNLKEPLAPTGVRAHLFAGRVWDASEQDSADPHRLYFGHLCVTPAAVNA